MSKTKEELLSFVHDIRAKKGYDVDIREAEEEEEESEGEAIVYGSHQGVEVYFTGDMSRGEVTFRLWHAYSLGESYSRIRELEGAN
jgi:hypothetical protein